MTKFLKNELHKDEMDTNEDDHNIRGKDVTLICVILILLKSFYCRHWRIF